MIAVVKEEAAGSGRKDRQGSEVGITCIMRGQLDIELYAKEKKKGKGESLL
jgi:hypothetical protein